MATEFITYYNSETCISGLTAAVLDFWLPLMLDNMLHIAIELAILENLVGAFGISILSWLQAEIYTLQV